MTNRVTSNKRDREKLKQQKRQEKQKRKDERQNSASRSFDDMIAYVDEFGRLHDTPPQTQLAEVDVEDIVISVSKKEDIQEVALNGRVEHFNSSKGYGFIKNLNNAEKYFFHITSAPAEIAEGNKVSFELERGARGMTAVRISIIKQ